MYKFPEKYIPVKKDIIDFLTNNTDYEDGSYGPLFVRLAWHVSGTYFQSDKVPGGSCTGMMSMTTNDPANAGLHIAIEKLEPIYQKHNWITKADLWTLAGAVSIEHMKGPIIPWRPGRPDLKSKDLCPMHGRLPDASQGTEHIKDVFCKAMPFSIQETVVLIGCHVLGRCHTDRSGYDGKWVVNPIRFSNQYFIQLLRQKWTKREWNGPEQFENEDKELMMLPTDMALLEQPWREWVELYANDKERFFKDFAVAFNKLIELGMPNQKHSL
ncbi:heme peroxidase [Neoconidiobolus thromboides FSU 785]|nr:heme peroxidase [Neoconidiobolus thromboides FSU 785]